MNRQQTGKKRRWLRWLNIVLVVYLLGGVILYFLQDYILFHPEKTARNHGYHFPEPNREVNITVSKESNINIIQFRTTDSIPRGVVLYFHGNRKNISWYAKYAPNFTLQGYEVWMIDYPGFGKSTGRLTEKKMYDDALQLYILARSVFPPEHIVLYGKSLGTGVAGWLASKRSCRSVILETPYYSMTSLTQHYVPVYPVSALLKYKLPLHTYLSLVNAPITIFHGTDDHVIPYSNSQRLRESLRPRDRFVTIEGGGHNNLNDYPEFHEVLDSVLQSNKRTDTVR